MRKTCTVAALVALTVVSMALGQEKFDPAAAAKAVAPFVNGRTVMVAHVDVGQVDVNALAGWLTEMMKKMAPSPQELADGTRAVNQQAEVARQWIADFTKAGGRHVYVVASLPDFPTRPPLIIVPLEPNAKPEALAALANKILGRRPDSEGPGAIQLGGALVAGEPGMLDRLKNLQPQPVPQIEAAFAAAGEGPGQLALIVTDEVRKFAANLAPAPGPDQPAVALTPGAEAVRQVALVQWIAVGGQLPPKPVSERLTIQCRNADDAAALGALVDKLAETLAKEPGEVVDVLKVRDLLKPTVDGDKLVIAVDDARYTKLVELLVPAMQRARAQANRAQSASNIHQIGMTLMMYAQDHNGRMPASVVGEDLKELGNYGLIERMLVNPSQRDRKPGYVYIRYPKITARTANVPNPIVLYEAYDKWEGGVNVGFMDGSVQFIADQAAFEKMLKASQDAAAELMKGNAGKPE